uniref:Uncharacterized protein n=1 Tax=Oryza sativa subsp. japonica TaxID=39947 RepID=Q6EQW9_ORYSJ|nr:hypothetical protein [Oryza sativa Japonica Group]
MTKQPNFTGEERGGGGWGLGMEAASDQRLATFPGAAVSSLFSRRGAIASTPARLPPQRGRRGRRRIEAAAGAAAFSPPPSHRGRCACRHLEPAIG